MLELPKYVPFRFARVGADGESGRLPTGWAGEGLSRLEVLDVDLSSNGPAISIEFSFDEGGESVYLGLTLGGYESIDDGEPFILKGEVSLTEAEGVDSVYWVIREWVSEGPFVGQSTRAVVLGSDVVVARCATSNGHVVQPVIVFKRQAGAAGGGRLTIRRLIFASLYRAPGWLASGAL